MTNDAAQLLNFHLSFSGCLLGNEPEPKKLARGLAMDITRKIQPGLIQPAYLRDVAARARALADALDEEALKMMETEEHGEE